MTREEKTELYNLLVAAHPLAERKGDTIPYTSLNGHMYSMLTKADEVAIRLPEAERGQFLNKYKSALLQQYGIVQKEYVVVPDVLLKKQKELAVWFDISYQYVCRLKPKPAAKSKKKAEK